MWVRPNAATTAAASLALTLGLIAAAVAWSDPEQRRDTGEGLTLSAAGALRIADSRGGGAILRAPALGPGASASGRVTIHNRGAAARLLLSRRRLLNTPGVGEDSLERALRLRVREITPGAHKLVYHGALATMPTLRLGPVAPGASRRYRFVASLPEPGLVDNSLMGARLRFDYRWQLRRQ
jgi:hypothetical protein